MRGDAILRTTLIEAIYRDNPAISTKQLQDLVVSYECNDSPLYRRYKQLAAAGQLPQGLPPPTGAPNSDATRFEAWICEAFEASGNDMQTVAPLVLNAVGFKPGSVPGGLN
jgi:hypothetical protein